MALPNDSASGMDVGSETGPKNVSATSSATTTPGLGEDVVGTSSPSADAAAALPPSSPSTPRQNMPVPAVNADTGPGSEVCDEKERGTDADTSSPTIGKIRVLQEQLFELERESESTREQKALAQMETLWDSQLKLLGSEKAKEVWNSERDARARIYFKDTTAFALSKEYATRQERSFSHRLMEQGSFDEHLMQRRRQWENAHGITEPSAGEVAPRPTWPGAGGQLQDLFRDIPYWRTDEARFNASGNAAPFDMKERDLRNQLNTVLREKHTAFTRWKTLSMPPPIFNEDVWAKPAINFAKWMLFKYKFGKSDWESLDNEFAIDALDGEPDPMVTEAHYKASKRDVVAEKVKEPDETPQGDATRMERALPVPERIRLNGLSLPRTLGYITKHSVVYTRSIVLLQPFCILVHLETALRERHEILKERFNTLSGLRDLEDGKEGTARQSTSQDLLHGGFRPEENDSVFEGGGSRDKAAEEEGHKPDDDHEGTQTDDDATSQQSSSTSSTIDENEAAIINSPETMEQLGCLVDFMDSYILPRKKYLRGTECRRVHFQDLWYLFEPGDEVIRRDLKQIYRVIGAFNPTHKVSSRGIFYEFDDDSTSNQFRLDCVYVDFNGKKLGPVREMFRIRNFAGERPIESLEVYPLRMHRNAPMLRKQNEKNQEPRGDWQALRQSFIRRGRKFFQAACMKLDNTFYNGPTEKGDAVESQVVIDFEMALGSDNNIGMHRSPLIQSLIPGEADDKPQSGPPKLHLLGCYGHCCVGETVLDDSWVDESRSEKYIESLLPKSYSGQPSVAIYPRNLTDTSGEGDLTDEEYVLMTYRVFAFVLRTRQWAELDLTYIEDDDSDLGADQVDSKTAFDHLMLPPGHKEIVQSLISQHFRNRDSGRGTIEHSDIVRGKGNGLILLLHGAPGVGKTSTAEGVADLFKKPLFTITCGDLGSTAKEVEKALDLNFNLANRWGCILLIDEADVFLTARTETDFERNGLVAVFLRVLEYYAGILFLTTNRVGVIDEAFRSRIHVSLHYPALDREQTEAVFKLNLKFIRDRFDKDKRKIRIERTDIIESALDYFDQNPKARWNGRQIRNACQTALALAEFKAQGGSHKKILDPDAEVHLAVENVQIVSKAYLDFTKYLRHLYGAWEGERAKELGLRAREGGRHHLPEQRFGVSADVSQPVGLAQGQMLSNMPPDSFTPTQGHPYPSAPAPGQPVYTIHQPGVATYYGTNLTPTVPAGNFVSYGNPAQAAATPTYQPNPGYVMQPQQPQQAQQPQPGQSTYPPQAHPWAGQVNTANIGAPQASSSMTGHPPSQAHQPMQQYTGHSAGAVHISPTPPVNPQFQGGIQQPMQQQQQPMQQQQQQPQQPEWPNFNIQALQSGEPGSQPGSSQ